MNVGPVQNQAWLGSVNSWQTNCIQPDVYLGIGKGVFREWKKKE